MTGLDEHETFQGPKDYADTVDKVYEMAHYDFTSKQDGRLSDVSGILYAAVIKLLEKDLGADSEITEQKGDNAVEELRENDRVRLTVLTALMTVKFGTKLLETFDPTGELQRELQPLVEDFLEEGQE